MVSNASGEFFPNNTLGSFTKFLPKQVNLEGLCEVEIPEISSPSMYQYETEGTGTFFDAKLSKSTSTYNLGPGLYTFITNFVEAMSTLIQERNNHNAKGRKLLLCLQTTPLVLHSVALTWVTFLVNVGKEFGLLMIGKAPHEPDFS